MISESSNEDQSVVEESTVVQPEYPPYKRNEDVQRNEYTSDEQRVEDISNDENDKDRSSDLPIRINVGRPRYLERLNASKFSSRCRATHLQAIMVNNTIECTFTSLPDILDTSNEASHEYELDDCCELR